MPRIVRFHTTGGPEVLQIEGMEVAAPGAGEVRIEVKAIGLNRAEAMFRSGQYLQSPVFPSTNGYECSGTIESIGPGVTGFKIGDKVSTIPAFSLNDYGAYGELVVMPVGAVTHFPPNLSWEEATSIWMQYLTAYGALVGIAQMGQGDTVLLPAASSSVGLAAIELCNLVGATPIALTRTSKKVDELKQAGAAHVIATEEEDLVARVMALTNNQGARIVFDPVGGPTIEKLTAAMSAGGIIFEYGALSTEPTPLPLFTVLGKSLTVRGYLLFEITSDPKKLEPGKKFIYDGLAAGKLKPIIARTFPFEEIVEAHRYMESNQQIGKIVVVV